MNIEPPEYASVQVLTKLAEFAVERASDVACGIETKELAGLLLLKYGYGLMDAYHIAYHGVPGAPSYADVDEAVAKIDPDWQQTQQQRWAARPAGLRLGLKG